jgi:hypothetical protein
MFSLWVFWGYRPLNSDNFYYNLWARWWIEGNFEDLAENWPGTLMRPYLYHAALGAVGNLAPTLLISEWSRPAIAAIQVASFASVTFRLASTVHRFERGLSRAVVIGLLCAPFAVLSNTEVLSESISLSIAGMAVAFACPIQVPEVGRFGNVVAVLGWLALLAMARTAHLPLALGASGAIVFMLLTSVARRKVNRSELTGYLVMAGAGLVTWAVVLSPQAWLMWWHDKSVPGDGALWGIAGSQLLWSQQMGKYATLVVVCQDVKEMGVMYPIPFVDGEEATGQFAWYIFRPHVMLLHLFQALNWDFPTTYISTFNPFVTVPLNAVSLTVVVVGLWTVASVAPRLIIWLVREAPVLGVVLAAIVGLWLQTAFTAVETRFGIIPWSALSVAASWGIARWWDRVRSGGGSWAPALYVVLATGALVVVSRTAVASVPVFQQLEAAGCWK